MEHNTVFESEEWRSLVRRINKVEGGLDTLEGRMNDNSAKLDHLATVQSSNHRENSTRLDRADKALERIGKMLVGERGDNGLVGTVTKMDGKINLVTVEVSAVKASLEDLKDTFKHLPKNIFVYLGILSAILALIQFLGPSLRKAVGLPSAHITAPAASISSGAPRIYNPYTGR